MLFELNDFKSFQKIMKTTSNILDEVAIILDEDGMRVSALDRPHICFINAEWDCTFFDAYGVVEPVKICVDIDEFVKVLSRGKNDDTMQLDIVGADLVIVFNGEANRTFKIRLLDDTYEQPALPDIPFDTFIEFMFDDFVDCMKDCIVFNDAKVTFDYSDETLKISADGTFGEYEGNVIVTEHNNVPAKAMYGTNYINYIATLNSMAELLKFEYGDDTPLKASIDDDMGCKVSFLIAPRLEEEM